MKKLLVILLASALLLCFASCAQKPDLKAEIIGDWILTGDEESPYGAVVAFTKTIAVYGFSVDVEEGQELVDYLPEFKRLAKMLEITYSVEEGFIILNETHMNMDNDETTGAVIPGQDARIPYTVDGDTLNLGGYIYTRIIKEDSGD